MNARSIGIVGAGRTRNGLGPFLAEFAERAGMRVTGVTGRSCGRSRDDAIALGNRLGHAVAAFDDTAELCRSGIDALIIASPTGSHRAALDVAARVPLPLLCDKPFVHEEDGAAGDAVVDAYAATGVPCMEICQWPYMLPALRQLAEFPVANIPSRIELALAPARPGREMVQSMLPHLLGVAQALVPIDVRTHAFAVMLDPPELDGRPTTLRFTLEAPFAPIALALHLRLCPTPPRPAWLAIDDVRMERHVGAGHAIAFDAIRDRVAVPDPVGQLVHHFADLVRHPTPGAVASEIARLRQRLRLYRQILGLLG